VLKGSKVRRYQPQDPYLFTDINQALTTTEFCDKGVRGRHIEEEGQICELQRGTSPTKFIGA